MRRNGQFPTLRAIAEKTGYSIMTVSRALNHPEVVKEDTRAAILSAVRELQYYPNSVARALSAGKTSIAYVYIPSDYEATNLFFMNVVAGIGEALGERDRSLIVKRSWYAGEPCDGIVLMGLREHDIEPALELARKKNCVLFGHVDGIDSIDVNNFEGLRLMTEHVLSRGKKRPLFLSIDEDRPFVRDRERGFLSMLPLGAEKDILRSANNAEDAYKRLRAAFGEDGEIPYDAILCASDDMAIGTLRYLHDRRIPVPGGIAVGGYDAIGRERLAVQRLTSVRQPIYEIGKMLAERLVERIDEAPGLAPECRLIVPTLVEGDTT